jgi:HEAT repeat protein
MRIKVGVAALAGAILLLGNSFAAPGDDKVAGLLNDLKSANAGTRARAAMALGKMGPSAKAAVPGLAEAVVDRDLNVRYYAAEALGAVGPEAKAAVPALIKALDTFPGGSPPLDGPQRYYADTRSVAAEALGAIGTGAREAVPALKKALNDPDPSVRSAAAEALKRIETK